MSNNKLSMVSHTRKRKQKKTKQKKTKQKKSKIIDVPLDETISRGTKESLGNINYHYRDYSNIFKFIKRVIYNDKHLSNLVCIPDMKELSDEEYRWLNPFLELKLHKVISNQSKGSVRPVDTKISKQQFIKEIKKCNTSRLVPINLEIIIPGVGSHSNIILLDNKKKTIELFEPHGNRHKKSKLESVSQGYFKISKKIKRYFSIYLPNYKYIPPSKYEPTEGLQYRLDAYSGLCVTWSLLWLHYRILNPDISQKSLIEYIDGKVTKKFLLRYTKYVEKTLK